MTEIDMEGDLDKKKFQLSQNQRLQIKLWICILGLMLILILLLGKLFVNQTEQDAGIFSTTPPEPVIQRLSNVWIVEEGVEGLKVFYEGEEWEYPWGIPYEEGVVLREQVADLTLTDGNITEIKLKKERINGRLLSAGQDWVEIEGYGKLKLADEYRGYRLYDSLTMCDIEDLIYGYNFTDFCIENEEICALLMVKEEVMQYIRVLLRNSDFEGIFHESVLLTADTDFTVSYMADEEYVSEKYVAGEEIEFTQDGVFLAGGRVQITPDVLTGKIIIKSMKRNQGIPSYRGTVEMINAEEGIVVINQVLLEEYLYSVVPSEMPSTYPEEALKAQAICARTYGYGHMEHAGYPKFGAHVDDSTLYQVYNNIREQATTTAAVKNTYGQLLCTAEGKLAETYYYSTSCGMGSDATVWKTESALSIDYLEATAINKRTMEEKLKALYERGEQASEVESTGNVGERMKEEAYFYDFITGSDPDDFEVDETWYRWTYEVAEIDSDTIQQRLQDRYNSNKNRVLTLEDGEYVSREVENPGEICDIRIVKRGSGGVADELVITGSENTYKVITEHNIRYVMDNGEAAVIRQDGGKSSFPTLLPSGYFVIVPQKEDDIITGYRLIGGGFGHGVGMSQNGAKEMAKCGYTAEEILLFFYKNCLIHQVYN